MHLETVKIKSSHPDQGEFIIINKSDFDSEKHELHVAKVPAGAPAASTPESDEAKSPESESDVVASDQEASTETQDAVKPQPWAKVPAKAAE